MLLVTLGIVLALVDSANAYDRAHIRVVGGNSVCSGTVEVFFGRHWSAICDPEWSLKDAQVACRELGCGLAIVSSHITPSGLGPRSVLLKTESCSGHEPTLVQCSQFKTWQPIQENTCAEHNIAGVQCSGKLEKPMLFLLSPYTAYEPGEAVRFSCVAPSSFYTIVDFHLFKSGVGTPLVTQGTGSSQNKAELTLTDMDLSHQGSYTCLYTVQIGLAFSSPESNPISISVVDLHTPQIWYNTSMESPPGRVIQGQNLNITCYTQSWYPGGSFQLRLIRFNGTVRHSVPALRSSFTFSFPNAQAVLEGYYLCLYRVQMGGRTFTSRESQPLPISIRDPEPLLSPMVVSWLVSAMTFVVAICMILIIVWFRCKKNDKPTELERDSRTCVDNTYVALPIK
ncbi:scavenger receptor cysteine-rich type 1 protein M130 [Scleropages formosus]|nr:scavenger receptor cysteine-rich type 1 protein M130-like [Scleropages formosus]